ncbi:MAG: hypothetical protein V3S30_09410 [Thermoanaerobaculia bacterium]
MSQVRNYRPSSGSQSELDRKAVVWLLIGGAVVCSSYLLAEFYLLGGELGFPLDDSWIHLQFARNLAAGQGLSYDGGILVTGSTAPLWTALLSGIFLLWGSPLWWAKLLGVGLYLTALHATFVLARELGLSRRLSTLAGLLTLSTSWLVWSALSGMEILLFTTLSLWGMILHIRELRDAKRRPYSLAVFGMAILARPEGALLLVLALIDRLVTSALSGKERLSSIRFDVSSILRGLVAAACVVAPVLIFYLVVGGSILPTTFAVKASSVRHWLPQMSYLYVVLGIFFVPQPLMTLLASGGVVSMLRRLDSSAGRGLLPGLWLIGLPLAYSLMSPSGARVLVGNAGRYYFPLFPVLIVMGVVGLERAVAGIDGRRGAAGKRIAVGVAVALALMPTLVHLGRGALGYAQSVADVQESDVRMARWLGSRLSPQALLAVNDIGALKYLLPNPVIDLAGIVNPEIQRAIQGAYERKVPWQGEIRRILAERRPDYLVVFPDWFPGMLSEGSGFVAQHVLENPDNKTMGGDRLVLFSTPWTRYPLESESPR